MKLTFVLIASLWISNIFSLEKTVTSFDYTDKAKINLKIESLKKRAEINSETLKRLESYKSWTDFWGTSQGVANAVAYPSSAFFAGLVGLILTVPSGPVGGFAFLAYVGGVGTAATVATVPLTIYNLSTPEAIRNFINNPFFSDSERLAVLKEIENENENENEDKLSKVEIIRAYLTITEINYTKLSASIDQEINLLNAKQDNSNSDHMNYVTALYLREKLDSLYFNNSIELLTILEKGLP